MIRYVDDDGKLVVKVSGLEKQEKVRARKNAPVIGLQAMEEDMRKMLDGDKGSKAFFCLEVRSVLTVVAAWEIMSLWYYLGYVTIRWSGGCEDCFHPLLTYWQAPGLLASAVLHPFSWALLCNLPDKKVLVVGLSLAAHILVMVIFILGSVCAYTFLYYKSLSVYIVLSLLYAYLVVLYNSLMSDISDGKYDIFHDIARITGIVLDYINSKL